MMATQMIATAKISNTYKVNGMWCMFVETTSEISWNVADQLWNVRYSVWVSVNDEFSQEFLAFVVQNESPLLETLGIKPSKLLALKSATNVMTFDTCRYEDVMICFGWYKLRYPGTLSCMFKRNEQVCNIDGTDKDIFIRIVVGDCRDMIFVETMQTAQVKRLDMWRMAFSSPFVKYNDISASFIKQIHPIVDASNECILARVASMTSQLGTFVEFLRFLHSTKIVYMTNANTYIRCGWAIYTIQRAAKQYAWRPRSPLTLAHMHTVDSV